MTEQEAIAAVERFARTRRHKLGKNVHARRVESDSLLAQHKELQKLVDNWIVSFGHGEKIDTFLVNHLTHQVRWLNGPLPWWSIALMWVLWPLTPLVIGPVALAQWIYDWWYDFRLPRCPRCNAKLRTHLAKQCRACKFDWHEETDSKLASGRHGVSK